MLQVRFVQHSSGSLTAGWQCQGWLPSQGQGLPSQHLGSCLLCASNLIISWDFLWNYSGFNSYNILNSLICLRVVSPRTKQCDTPLSSVRATGASLQLAAVLQKDAVNSGGFVWAPGRSVLGRLSPAALRALLCAVQPLHSPCSVGWALQEPGTIPESCLSACLPRNCTASNRWIAMAMKGKNCLMLCKSLTWGVTLTD